MPESLASGGAGRRIAILLVRVGVTRALSWGVGIRSAAQTSPPRDLEISIVGQNLLSPRPPEFLGTEVERSVFGKITWRF